MIADACYPCGVAEIAAEVGYESKAAFNRGASSDSVPGAFAPARCGAGFSRALARPSGYGSQASSSTQRTRVIAS